MKKLLLSLALFATIFCQAQVKTDAELITQSDVIRNETSPGGNTKERIANMFRDIIRSKTNVVYALTASGTNSYTGIVANPLTSYADGAYFIVEFTNANSAASTLNINGLGAIAIKKNTSIDVASGNIAAGRIHILVFDGTNFQLVTYSESGGGGASSWGSITGDINSQSDLITLLNAKQATLISGTNLKTINGTSLLGSGDVVVGGAVNSVYGRTGTVTAQSGDYTATQITLTPTGGVSATNVQSAVSELDTEKQVALVSGTNIKTVNGTSILGSGDIAVGGGGVPTSRLISTTAPLAGGGDLSADRTLTIGNAAADGSTKGAAAFIANDFDASSGVVSLDYTNGQKATVSVPGFLSNTDFTTFNNKASTAYADGKVADAIVDGVTTVAPSQNAVYDALAGKEDDGVSLEKAANLSDVTSASASLLNIGGLAASTSYNTQTGDYTIQASDLAQNTTVIMNNGATPRVVNLPLGMSSTYIGRTVQGVRTGTESITFTPAVGTTLVIPGGSNNDPGKDYPWAVQYTASNTWKLYNGGIPLGTANQLYGVDNAGTTPEYKTPSNGIVSASGTVQWGGAITSDRTLTGAFNIGFGATPTSKFHVTGTGTGTGSTFKISDSGNTTRFDLLDNGKSTWTTATSGTGLLDYSFNSTWTATANSQTHSYYELNVNQVPGAFTGLAPTFLTLKSSTLNYLIASQTGGWIMDNFSIYGFRNGSAQAILRNDNGPISLRGGTTSSTSGIELQPTFSSSANNNVTVGVVGTSHALGTAPFTRNFDVLKVTSATTSIDGNTITSNVVNAVPSYSVGTSTLTINGITWNPSITGTGTINNYGLRIMSGRSAFGSAVPNSTVDIQGSFKLPVVAKTASYTLTDQDYTVILTTGSATFTLPSAVGIEGRIYVLKNAGGGTLTVATTSSQTVDGSAPGTVSNQLRLQAFNGNWIVI